LFAMPELPPLASAAPRSALLADQGYAVLRREGGRLYAALDYGHSGAGHGHPDRLNFVLVHGFDRWLDDVGTGSYVDPSLHWYRSTLAHNAPLVDGRSQERVHGRLIAYEDRGDAGWVRASVDGVAPGVSFDRAVVAMPDYVIDELTWRADYDAEVDLPFHVDGELLGVGVWSSADPHGGSGVEDGFSFLADTETAVGAANVRLRARLGASTADVYFITHGPSAWWRATALGAPGSGNTRFHFVRTRGPRGRVLSVWDVHGSVESVARLEAGVLVSLRDGTRHEHARGESSWQVIISASGGATTVGLGGARGVATLPAPKAVAARAPLAIPRMRGREQTIAPLVLKLSEPQYRRSEATWADAAKPRATVSLSAEADELVVVVDVQKRDVYFARAVDYNSLDNENPDTNSDGVQLHVIVRDASPGGKPAREINWLLVPEPDAGRVRVSARAVGGVGTEVPPVRASWRRTMQGYSVRIGVPLGPLGIGAARTLKLGVVVNDMTSDRERRRGQLVLGGRPGEFVYLRGDRLPAEDLLDFRIADA
jgi:heparinase II/III-like protein